MVIKQSLPIGVTYLIIELILSFFIASIVKLLEPNLPIFQILFYRYLLCLPLLIIYGLSKHGLKIFYVNNIGLLLLRILCGFLGLVMWFLAVATIDISLATVLFNTMSLFITILSVIIARESVGLRRSAAVVVGFLGVVFIISPMNASFNFSGVIYALLGAVFSGSMFVFIRMLGKTNASIPTAIWYNSFGVVVSLMILFVSENYLNGRTSFAWQLFDNNAITNWTSSSVTTMTGLSGEILDTKTYDEITKTGTYVDVSIPENWMLRSYIFSSGNVSNLNKLPKSWYVPVDAIVP